MSNNQEKIENDYDEQVDINDLINEEYLDKLLREAEKKMRFETKTMLTTSIVIGFVQVAWVVLESVTVFHSLIISLIITIIAMAIIRHTRIQ